MNIGDVIEYNNKKYRVQCFCSAMAFTKDESDAGNMMMILRRVEEPKPDIRWERIPDCVYSVQVTGLRLRFQDENNDIVSIFEDSIWRDWFFPHWRDFTGQTFERPKGCDV